MNRPCLLIEDAPTVLLTSFSLPALLSAVPSTDRHSDDTPATTEILFVNPTATDDSTSTNALTR
jgi:hypothetical protein